MDGPKTWYELFFSGALVGGLAGSLVTIVYQWLTRRWNRPRLVLLTYKHCPPMYRLALDVRTDVKAFYVNIGVRNTGRTVAERCREVVTAMAELKQERWVKDENWLPVDLRWSHHHGLEPERNLIPEPKEKVKPLGAPVAYYFSIASFNEKVADRLCLNTIYALSAQRTSFPPGIYAAQIPVYSANGDWASRWYELIFRGAQGSFSGDQLTVRELQAAPIDDL